MLPTDPPAAPPPADAPGQPPSRYRLTRNVRAEAAERRRLARDLKAATHDGMLLLHYLPRLALADGRVVGAAAQIRWPLRKRGLPSPRMALPPAEHSGQMPQIDAWALAAACRDAAGWPEPYTVSVTLTAGRFGTGALLRQVAAALAGSGLAPDRLELSLPEALLLDLDSDADLVLAAIRDLGVGLALDDFGTGLASLAMLKRLPLTTVTLDRALIRDLPASREDAAIVRAAIATGHELGLSAVADGVETDAQCAMLARCGCDQGQGPQFSQAMPAGEVAARLAAQEAARAQP